MITNDFVIAADIGGTHVTSALIDIGSRKIIVPSITRREVNSSGTVEEIITAWSQCMLRAEGEAKILKVCIAMPGPFDYEKGISLMKGQSKYDTLYQHNVKEYLARAMHMEPGQFFTCNDAASFLHGEVFAGCAQGEFKKVKQFPAASEIKPRAFDF